MSQTIKAAIVGTGFIGPAHLEALRRIPNVEVVALVEVNQALADEKAKLLGISRAYVFDDMLRQDDIDVVHICTPNFLHFSQAKAVLEAEKHVICEKPLAISLKEAEELVRIAKTTGLVNAVHFNLRYYPMVRQMKVMREKGELGEVYSIMGSYLQDWLFLQTDYNWRLEPDKSGDSRAIADIGSHLLDITEYVTGLKITQVMADFSTVHKTRLINTPKRNQSVATDAQSSLALLTATLTSCLLATGRKSLKRAWKAFHMLLVVFRAP